MASLEAPILSAERTAEPPTVSSAWWAGDPESLPLVDAGTAPREILAVENFLDRGRCELIRAAFNMSRGKLGENSLDPFWRDRLLWFDQIDSRAIGAKAVMQQARFVIAYRIAEHFGVEGRLYSDSQQLVLWNEGQSMPAHVDNAHPDGSPHPTPFRDFAAVLYLNEEFEGGEIFFPLQGIRLRPTTGMLIGFRGTAAGPHGVTAVRKGERFTMPSWYSLDPSVAEPSMFTIF